MQTAWYNNKKKKKGNKPFTKIKVNRKRIHLSTNHFSMDQNFLNISYSQPLILQCLKLLVKVFKCHCQRKSDRAHGSRLADYFQIPTTDYLSDMISYTSLFLANLHNNTRGKFGVTCASYFTYLLPVFSVFRSM